MGTVGAIVVLLVLLISAAVTLVVILVTVPSDDDDNVRITTLDTDSDSDANNLNSVEHSTYRSTLKFLKTTPLHIEPKLPLTTTIPDVSIDTPTSQIANDVTDEFKDLPFVINNILELSNGSLEQYNTATTDETVVQPTTLQPIDVDNIEKTDQEILNIEKVIFGSDKESVPNSYDTTELNLLREIQLQKESKIIGMAYQQGLLYIGSLQGVVQALNPVTGQQVKEITVGERTERMTVSRNQEILILRNNQIRSFRDGRNVYEVDLPFSGKAIAALDDRIVVLSYSGISLAILSNSLEIIKKIHIRDSSVETCNFVVPHNNSYYISCDNVILHVSEDGKVINHIGQDEGSFSLGITFDSRSRLIAVVRGKPRLKIFQDGKQVRELYHGDSLSIWTEVLYERGRLHVIDYLTYTLSTFQYPVDLL